MREVLPRIRHWYDENFTIKGLVALIAILFSAIPDWRYYIEFWTGKVPYLGKIIFEIFGTTWGRFVVFAVGGVIVWLDHRSVIKKWLPRPNEDGPVLRIADNGYYHDIRNLKGVGHDGKEKIVVRIADLSCLHLKFKNDPTSSTENAVARILAEIEYYDVAGKRLSVIHGRWGDTPEPPALPEHQTTEDTLTTVQFAIGQTRELDIAFKYQNEECCYAMSNQSYGTIGWRVESHKLPVGKIRVHVRLRGGGGGFYLGVLV